MVARVCNTHSGQVVSLVSYYDGVSIAIYDKCATVIGAGGQATCNRSAREYSRGGGLGLVFGA